MPRRRLPIGIQTFREIRETDCYYVDKTDYVHRLIDEGKHYFLSRPRRFGKSLLLDTMKELFEGNEPLFKGLDVHDRWDWSVRCPVLRLSFGSGDFKQGDFKRADHVREYVMARLEALAEAAGVPVRHRTASLRFGHLIGALRARAGQRVAVLIDEYDKPVLDALDTPEVARANRDFLAGFYATIRERDADVCFSFMTGVSKFSMAGTFPGLENQIDVTMDPRYSAICGFTEAELDAVFAPELTGLDRNEIRDWYNGFNWLGEEKVYNPFDVLMLFDRREFGAWWFETGTPAFPVEILAQSRVGAPDLDGMLGSDQLLSAFDVGRTAVEALLFQTGCLTIAEVVRRGSRTHYRLGYPNRAVRQSLNERLLRHLVKDPSRQRHLVKDPSRQRQPENTDRLNDLLRANDFAGLKALFNAFFASIPHERYTSSDKANNDMANYEGYYASVFYAYFASLGIEATVEDSSRIGRLDLAVRFNGNVYLFEFKVVEMAPEGAAMDQLKARRYADKYRAPDQPIYLIAAEFSRDARNLASFEVERA